MYAKEFAAGRGIKPGSMTLALAMTALPIVGMIASMGVERLVKNDPVFVAYPVHDDPPPPPDIQPKAKPDAKTPISQTPYVPKVDPVLPSDNHVATTTDPGPVLPPQPEVGTGTIPGPVITPKPVVVGASYDPRFAAALQPPYPASEQRAGNSGRVVLRVLIGTDGRVRQVERVAAASDAFFAAAERQALTKWRFRPATSDGVAIEQWKTMSLRFELQED